MARKNGAAVDFLAAAKTLRREKIEIDGLPVIYARELSAAEVRRLSQAHLRDGKSPNDDDAFDNDGLAFALVAASLVYANGKAVVPPGRAEELQHLPHATLNQLQQVALRINGMDTQPGN